MVSTSRHSSAFISSVPISTSPFVTLNLTEKPSLSSCTILSHRRAKLYRNDFNVTKAVLDTPASNTYLQRHAELALRDFLTRRAVSTVLYYMHEFHDGPSHHWLNKFDDFSTKVKSRMFTNGDQFLEKMRRAPNEKGYIKVGHPSGRFSRKFPFVIEPRRIASRIVDVRVQLAGEWAHDLNCIEPENLEIQRLSFERLVTKSETELDSKRNLIFDSDPVANDQTPLRYKNYGALKTLLTQHAVMRLLPYLRDKGSNHEYMYLLQFLGSFGPIGDDVHFIHTLMSRPAESRTNPSFLVVPSSIAAQILEVRLVLAKEWISALQFVPVETKLSTCGMLEKSLEASHDLPDNGHSQDTDRENGLHNNADQNK